MPNRYPPPPEHKFTFGLWTPGDMVRGRFDVQERHKLSPADAVRGVAQVGASGAYVHDNNLIPIATSERDQIRIHERGPARRPLGVRIPGQAQTGEGT